MHPGPLDRLGRPQRSLRLSVTDRCNLRCGYCMPEENYVWLPKSDLLDFEELRRLVGRFVLQGVDKLRLTGGEPLLRQDLEVLVAELAALEGLRDISLTTNAVLLPRLAEPLRAAGLRRVTVSLDTLRPDRFAALAGRDQFAATMEGIEAARQAGFQALKLNTVVMRGRNDDELVDLLRFGREQGLEVRFIEYMDVGGATRWHGDLVVSRREILARIAAATGGVEAVQEDDWAPADRYRSGDGTVFGVISSTTEPFCRTCDRTRLTADGRWFTCLYAREGVDLRGAMRSGATDEELDAMIARVWGDREDRGAEQRLELRHARGPLAEAGQLRQDPHLEMHTRGG